MRALFLTLWAMSGVAFGAADLVVTQQGELSQAEFNRGTAVVIGTDTAETGTTDQVINATGHAARIGDLLRFTDAGANFMLEVHVKGTTANTITLTRTLPAAPTNGANFTILRLITASVSSSGSSTVIVTPGGTYADSARNAYASTPVTTDAWVQLIASTAATIHQFALFDSCGETLQLGTGAAASETRVAIIPPGGLDNMFPLTIPAGTRLSVKAISANCTTGELDFTGIN